MKQKMTIQSFAKRAGISKSALRYYEAEGLLQPSRSESGYRLYTEEQLDTVQMIQSLRLANIPLIDIQRYLQADDRQREELRRTWVGALKRKHALLGLGIRYLETLHLSQPIHLIEQPPQTILWFAASGLQGRFGQQIGHRVGELQKNNISYDYAYLKYLSGKERVEALIGFGVTQSDVARLKEVVKDIISVEHLPASLCLALHYKGELTKIEQGYRSLMEYALTYDWMVSGALIERYSGESFQKLELLLPVAQITHRNNDGVHQK